MRHKTCRGHAKRCCATNVHTSTIFLNKFGATATWKMTKICSNYVHYVARISFEVDWHLTVHDLSRTIWSHNLKCRTTHVAPTIHTTTDMTRIMSHNHVVPSRTTKFLSVWTHLNIHHKMARRFRTMEDELQAAAAKALSNKESWYHDGINKFVYRYNKTLDNYRDCKKMRNFFLCFLFSEFEDQCSYFWNSLRINVLNKFPNFFLIPQILIKISSNFVKNFFKIFEIQIKIL